MGNLIDIHSVAIQEIKKKFSLTPVKLTHPFPERPKRTLGLIQVDGDVFTSDKFSRITFLRINLPVYMKVRSTFLRPRMELDLPIFSAESVIMGSKRMFMLDMHRTGESERKEDTSIFDKLIKIRNKYSNLLKYTKSNVSQEIQAVFSRAVYQGRIPNSLDNDALNLFREYLGVFLEMVGSAAPLSGDKLEAMKKSYAEYLKTVVDHDPGVKGYKMFFGEKGGVERSMEMFFNQ